MRELRSGALCLCIGLTVACTGAATAVDEPTETFHNWGRTETYAWGQFPPATSLAVLEAALADWPRTDVTPAGWDLREMAVAALPRGGMLDEAKGGHGPCLLAWRTVQDDRPLLILCGLLLTPLRTTDGETRFLLASMYRHPADEDEWSVSEVTHAVFAGSRQFTTRPTRIDVLKFMNDCRWLFESAGQPSCSPNDGWATLDIGLSPAAWEHNLR